MEANDIMIIINDALIHSSGISQLSFERRKFNQVRRA